MNTALRAAERGREVVVLGAEHDVGDVLEPHDRAVLLLDRRDCWNSSTECRLGAGGQIDADHLALGRAERREIVVVGERRAHVARGHAVRRQPVRDRARRAARTGARRGSRRSARPRPNRASA